MATTMIKLTLCLGIMEKHLDKDTLALDLLGLRY